MLLTRAFAFGNPSRVAVVSLSQIVFALVPDVLIFKHPPHPGSLLGIVLITAPTAWVMLHARHPEQEEQEEERRLRMRDRAESASSSERISASGSTPERFSPSCPPRSPSP